MGVTWYYYCCELFFKAKSLTPEIHSICQGKLSKLFDPLCSNENVDGLATQRVGLQDPAVSHSGSHPFVILHLTSSPARQERTMKNLIDSNNLICLEGMTGLEKHTNLSLSLSHSHTHTHSRSSKSDQGIDRFSLSFIASIGQQSKNKNKKGLKINVKASFFVYFTAWYSLSYLT